MPYARLQLALAVPPRSDNGERRGEKVMKNHIALLLAIAAGAGAQAPTGTITGLVLDPSASAVGGARVTVLNLGTGLARAVITSERGDYSFPSLAAGVYEVRVSAPRFHQQTRTANVEAGATTTADFSLSIGEVTESVTVDSASPQIRYDSHSVGGLISRSQIQALPLNGRTFLELAKLEPGVQPPNRAANNRTGIPTLGAPGGNLSGRGTRVTLDGGSVMAFSTGGSVMGLSQDIVQEFQISTVNLDLSNGLTFTGAVNVATRTGGNQFHGAAFYFFRDHTLSAYPALNHSPRNPDPFFQRRQFGFSAGGPVRRNRTFFFGNWERNEQRGVAVTTIADPNFAHLSRITPTPLFGNQLSVRLDSRLSRAHTGFVRYSHDGSHSFAPVTGIAGALSNPYPSNWGRQVVWADQSILGLTSVVTPRLVNDIRFSYFYLSANQLAPSGQDCPGCLGLGAPTITIPQAGLNVGQSTFSLNPGRRFHLNDGISWQPGAHRVRFGADWEHNRGGLLSWANEPATITLFSPTQVRNFNNLPSTTADQQIALPGAFNILDDILQLPLLNATVAVGDPRVPQANGSTVRTWDTFRLYIEDSWRLRQRLTVNYGLAWNVDRYKNYDLVKPALLEPILGRDGLGPTRKQWKNFSPMLGFAWAPSKDRKTVIRAGAGIYYDFLLSTTGR